MPSSLQRSQVEPTDASRVPSVAEECGGSEPDPVVASPLHWFHLYFPERKFTEDLEVLIDDYDTHRATTRATTLAASSPGAAFLVANKQGGPSQPLKSSTNGRAQANLTFPSLNVEQLAKQGKDFDLIFADRRCESREQAAQWLAQLRHMLRPDGVLHLTLPGRYGNQGLEMLRQLIRLMEIRPGAQGKAKVDTLLRNLCENDTVKLDRYETEALSQNPRLAHMLFEPGHVSFSVPECLALIRAAGLRFQRFFYQAHYLPQCSTLAKQPDLLTDVLALPEEEQYAVVELYRASAASHELVVRRDDLPVQSYRISFDGNEWEGYVPVRNPHVGVETESLPQGAVARLRWEAHQYPEIAVSLDATQAAVLDMIDDCMTTSNLLSVTGLGEADGGVEYVRTFLESMWRFDYLWFKTGARVNPPGPTWPGKLEPGLLATLGRVRP